jgi:ComF family protein
MEIKKLFFPRTVCALCGKEIHQDAPLCSDCRKKINQLRRPAEIMGDLVKGHAVFLYRSEIKTLILDFKYRDQRHLKDLFVAEILGLYEEMEMAFETVIPVPDARERRWLRGFNPSRSLAGGLAKATGTPLSDRLVTRVRNTRPLKEIPLAERRDHVRGAFSASNPKAFRRGLLIDDIYTTGATVEAVGLALYEAGFEELVFLAVASNY